MLEDRENRGLPYPIQRFALLSDLATGTLTVEIFTDRVRCRVNHASTCINVRVIAQDLPDISKLEIQIGLAAGEFAINLFPTMKVEVQVGSSFAIRISKLNCRLPVTDNFRLLSRICEFSLSLRQPVNVLSFTLV